MNHPTTDKELREKLASIEHERWADWQNYVHRVYLEGNFKEFMLRWQKQIGTPYSELSDQEKASDMEQVNRYWHLIEAHTAAARIELIKKIDQLVGFKVIANANPIYTPPEIGETIELFANEIRDSLRERIKELEAELKQGE